MAQLLEEEDCSALLWREPGVSLEAGRPGSGCREELAEVSRGREELLGYRSREEELPVSSLATASGQEEPAWRCGW